MIGLSIIRSIFYRNTLQVKGILNHCCVLLAIFSVHIKFDMQPVQILQSPWQRTGCQLVYIRVAVDLVRLGFMPWCGLMPVGIPAARPCEQSLVVAVVVSYLASMVEGTGGHRIWQYPSQ